MFGIVLGIGTQAETTETFLLYNNPNDQGFTWATANFENNISIDESRENPFNNYDDNKPTFPWERIATASPVEGNTFSLKMKRPFDLARNP
jgi:hypothetical protein